MARRVRFFDSLRGLSVLSMVGFHLCYDLRYLAGLSLPWFQGTFQDVWRASISWVFLFLAGVMSSYSLGTTIDGQPNTASSPLPSLP